MTDQASVSPPVTDPGGRPGRGAELAQSLDEAAERRPRSRNIGALRRLAPFAIEETAAYLDGAGRQESKRLDRTAALAYAAESMRLTTRLMQVASWLLVQRAVREGDMAPEAACEERYRLAAEMAGAPAAAADILPAGLVDLMERSERLFERVRHLDRRMYVDVAEDAAPNPVLSQFDRLRSAFGAA